MQPTGAWPSAMGRFGDGNQRRKLGRKRVVASTRGRGPHTHCAGTFAHRVTGLRSGLTLAFSGPFVAQARHVMPKRGIEDLRIFAHLLGPQLLHNQKSRRISCWRQTVDSNS